MRDARSTILPPMEASVEDRDQTVDGVDRRDPIARMFAIVYVPLAAVLVLIGAGDYFGAPMYEIGDFAANALQIERAKQGAEILGNYSRFGFHHPGPAFFYVYALGDFVFHDLLHLVPAHLNAYALAGILLQSAFLALGLVILSTLTPHRWTFIVAGLGAALVVFTLSENPAFNIWPPTQIVIPFFCFLAAGLALALGHVRFLPVLVVCGGFLVHGHVAQPLFVLPVFAIAYGSFLVSMRRTGVPFRRAVTSAMRPHLWALAAAAIFLAPIVLDALQPNPNIGIIVEYLKADHPSATWGRGLFHVLSFVVFREQPPDGVFEVAQQDRLAFLAANWPKFGGWAIVLTVSAVFLWNRGSPQPSPAPDDIPATGAQGRRFVGVYYALLAAVTVLTVFWGKSQFGLLYAFNTYFYNAVLLVAALAPAFAVAQVRVVENRRLLTGGITTFMAMVAFAGTWGPPPAEPSAAQLHRSATRLLERSPPDRPVLLEFEQADWVHAAGLAVILERHGVTYLVRPHWGFMLGYEHVYPGSPLVGDDEAPVRWVLRHPDAVTDVEVRFNDQLALASVEDVAAP